MLEIAPRRTKLTASCGSALLFPLQVRRLRLQTVYTKTASQSQCPPGHRPSMIYASSNTVIRPRHARIPSRKDQDSDACL